MKLVLVSGSLPAVRCGIGEYTARLASQLALSPGITVQVLTTKNALVRPEAVAPAQVVRLVPGWSLPSVIRWARLIHRLAPDVVHIQYPAVGYERSLGVLFLPLAVRWLARVPVVLTIHERSERRWHGRLATDFMALTSSRIVVPDPIEAEALRGRLRIFGTRVDVTQMISTIPINGDADRAAFRARLGLAPGELLLGTFGLIHPRRRLEDIIDSLVALRRSTASHLLIVGGEADYDAQRAREYTEVLKRKIGDLGLSGSVTWLGYASSAEVSEALQACEVAALLYREGASQRNTTLEAVLEHRLPVVTTDGPATSDSLRATPNITFVRAGAYTPADLARAILSAARTGWADAGQRPAGSRLSQQVEAHVNLYRELIPARSETPSGAPPR
ncbi:MAG TPA: glycosyltransferase [Candidatus Dormibacteraeota bacterium]|nr:glycosyltransferase [Candidatus Dormibacteraeota bacterium]